MKLFSPEKANALIPKLAPLIDELWFKRRDLAIKLLESDPQLRGVPPPSVPSSRLAGIRSPLNAGRFSGLKAEIMRIVERIEAHGCLVKDLDLGLIDFPSTRDGRPICLCWKSGESRVAHWHGVDEGFADRKPLDD
jgi:hypothetical protein